MLQTSEGGTQEEEEQEGEGDKQEEGEGDKQEEGEGDKQEEEEDKQEEDKQEEEQEGDKQEEEDIPNGKVFDVFPVGEVTGTTVFTHSASDLALAIIAFLVRVGF
jgi:hypothetical protein